MAFKDTVKEWFKTGFKPTQAQFYSKFDFLRWKDEKIPIGDIEEIENILNEKADAEALTNHVGDAAAHAALFAAKADAQALLNHIQATFEGIGIEAQSRVYGDESLQFQIDDTNDFVSQARSDIEAINTLLTSNDINLDTVQEIVDAIKTVETSLSTILVNDLTTGGTTKALTAEMGKTLKGLIDGLVVPTATDTVRGIVKTDVPVADPVVYVQETVDTLLEGKANYFLDIKPITGISYNPIITDILNQLLYDGTLPMNVIIPNNATVPFPVGSTFYTLATNTGILTASGASGVVLKVKSGISLSAIQNEVRQYTKIGVNTWSVRGDLNLGAVTQTELSYLQGATSNLQAQINAKTALSGGVTNYLMKWLTATTATVSRIWDTGTYLGIGTINAPTKDLTFGNQADREIGVEESDNNSVGRNLMVRAGRAVNYIVGSPIVYLPGSPNAQGMYVTVTDDIITVSGTTQAWKKLAGSSTWNGLTLNVGLDAICRAPNGNVYGISSSSGLIYMQTGGTGNFVSVGAPVRSYKDICSAPNGDIYVCVDQGDIYKQTAGSGAFNALGQTGRRWGAMTAASNGDIYAGVYWGGGIYMQTAGAGSFNLVQAGVGANGMFVSGSDVYAVAEDTAYIAKQTAGVGAFNVVSGHSNRLYQSGIATSNGDLYFGTYQTGIYRLQSTPVGTANLDGGTLKQVAGTGKGTGKSRFEIYTGQKQASGTEMQPETLREYIDENGYHVYTSMPVYADNSAALAGGLPVGCEYRTATGVKMIVY